MYIKVIASQTWDVFETHCSLHVVAQAFCREFAFLGPPCLLTLGNKEGHVMY